MPFLRILFVVLFTIGIALPSLANMHALEKTAVILPKERDNKIEVVKTFLSSRQENGRTKIWVFFTDKGLLEKSNFDGIALSSAISERAITRREKMNLGDITFGDLPVSAKYIAAIESRGGKLRRISKWLNAASFEIDFDNIDEVNSLPFIRRIRPVASFLRSDEDKSSNSQKSIGEKGLQSNYSLNYGLSLTQLEQINVPVVHDKGYNGKGVLIAILDTGFRKDHQAFSEAINSGRFIAEWDFVFDDGETRNEPEDIYLQDRHGTWTLSALGGAYDGELYGPAYGASFILAKTEDERSETQVEEDNWVAAMEWADSIGADLLTSSLGYSDWYNYEDLDGETAITTIAANLATSYGITVIISMGNTGPGEGTVMAPADAFDIISVGAVNSSDNIVRFSSRGPTYDNRIKPEVCAMGLSTYCAYFSDTNTYSYASGTSFSAPLVAGCAAILLSARPDFTPQLVRQALIETASRSKYPDNIYGYGIIDIEAALNWGADIVAINAFGPAPLEVSFHNISPIESSAMLWTFGDGNSSSENNPIHIYNSAGVYNVVLTITTIFGDFSITKSNYVHALADTIYYGNDTVYAGQQGIIEISLTNTPELSAVYLPIDLSGQITVNADSLSVVNTRSEGFSISLLATANNGRTNMFYLHSDSLTLPSGSGVIARLFVSTSPYAFDHQQAIIDTITLNQDSLKLVSSEVEYVPSVISGNLSFHQVLRGDANNDSLVDLGDVIYLINYIFRGGPGIVTIESGDANFDFRVNLGDAIYLIHFLFKDGPPPIDKK